MPMIRRTAPKPRRPIMGVAGREAFSRRRNDVKGTGFRGTCRIELEQVPEMGAASPLRGLEAL